MKKLLLKITYLFFVCAFLLLVLEFAARALGAGDPILYYNAAAGGMRPIPDQQISRGNDALVTVDQYGFRSASTDSSARKILYLGDSVTWGGTRIDDGSTFAEQTSFLIGQQLREKIYSMNAAVNGHSLMNQADIYFATEQIPDLVVWLFPEGDLNRSYATAGHLWPSRFKPSFALVEVVDGLLSRFWSSSFRQRSAADEKYVHPDTPLGKDEFFRSVISERRSANLSALNAVIDDVSKRGIPMIVGVTPTKLDGQWQSGEELLTKIELSESTIAFDVLGNLKGQNEDPDKLFVDNVHFNKEGHLAVSRLLSFYVKSAMLLTGEQSGS